MSNDFRVKTFRPFHVHVSIASKASMSIAIYQEKHMRTLGVFANHVVQNNIKRLNSTVLQLDLLIMDQFRSI